MYIKKYGDVAICLAYYNEIPMGVCIIHDSFENQYWIFVRKNERRKGIGTAMIKCFQEYNLNSVGHLRCRESGQMFFKSLNLIKEK